MNDQSEYLIVVTAFGDGGSNFGHRIHSIRCNKPDTAEKIAIWLRENGPDMRAEVFFDPPKIGQRR